MENLILVAIDLRLFEGGTAGAAGAAPAAGDGGNKGDTNGVSSAITRRGKAEEPTVIYGKRNADETGGDPEITDVKTTSNTLEERRKAWSDLINGEYKDIYTEETQKMINRRFKETKGLQDQLDSHKPIMDLLAQKYKIDGSDIAKLQQAIENDDAYWSEEADELGMTVEQLKHVRQLERENAQLVEAERQRAGAAAAQQQVNAWIQEGEQLKATYPDFDLARETQDPRFVNMLKSGIPVALAYQSIHMDEILAGTARTAAQQAEKRVTDNIRARGRRPSENGTSSQGSFVYKDDVSKLSPKDRADIARRAMMGELISF